MRYNVSVIRSSQTINPKPRLSEQRICARAMRRAGELLKQIEPQQGARTDLGEAPPQSRKQAMAEAGMSVDQGKTALRVASMPEPEFTAQVESEHPPTVTELARQGTPKRDQAFTTSTD